MNQGGLKEAVVRQGKINGGCATRVYLDTGSSLTLVHRRFVPSAVDTGKQIMMRNTTGTHQYPIAVATIELDGRSYTKEVAVSDCLQEDALLGTDIPLWPHLVRSMNPEEKTKLAKELVKEENRHGGNSEEPVTATAYIGEVDDGVDDEQSELTAEENSLDQLFHFDDSLFSVGANRTLQTRAEKRRGRVEFRQNKARLELNQAAGRKPRNQEVD